MKNELDEAKEVLKKFGYRAIREAAEDEEDEDPLADESEEIRTMVRELAEYTGNDYADAEVREASAEKFNIVGVSFGRKEYDCFASFDEAVAAAEEDCKQTINDVGLEGINFGYIGGIEEFVDTKWFEEARRESAESYVSDLLDSDSERYEDEFGDLDEEDAVEQYLSTDGYSDDPVQWYIDNFGQKDFERCVRDNYLIDEDALAAAIVEADGPANSLARYDGEEIELDCGYYCYRAN